MKEKEFQTTVMQLARLKRWRVAHFGNTVKIVRAKGGGYRTVPEPHASGFPDLVLVKGDRLIFAELKAEHGKVRPEQREWLAALAATGVETYLWKPSDWAKITEVLV